MSKVHIQLRDYQHHAVNALKSLFREGHRGVLYVLPTGGGKTPVFCEMLRAAVRRKKRCAVFVHRRVLQGQAEQNLELFGLRNKVPVITVQNREYEKWALDFIVFDEAHHCPADSWSKIQAAQRNAQLLGVTATPWRMDDKPLGNTFSAAVEGPSVCDLVAGGWMVEPEMWVPPDGEPADNPVALYKRKASGLRTLVFTNTVAKADELAREFREAGIPSASLSAKTSDKKRNELFDQFVKKEVCVLISCDVISEGFDVPCVEVVMLLRQTKSSALYLQQVGRALRPHPDKKTALVLDCVNNLKTHGSPLETRKWSLTFGSTRLCDQDNIVHTGFLDTDRKWGRRDVELNKAKHLVRLKHSTAVEHALRLAEGQRALGYQWAHVMSVALKRRDYLIKTGLTDKALHQDMNMSDVPLWREVVTQ